MGSKKGKCGGEGHGFSWDILTCKGEGLGPMAQISLALNFGAVFNFFREHRRQAGRGGATAMGLNVSELTLHSQFSWRGFHSQGGPSLNS